MRQRTPRMTDRRAAMFVALCSVQLLLAFLPRCAPAQLAPANPFGSTVDDQRLLSDIFLTPRYETRRRLTQAKALLDQRRYGEAVTLLDRLLTQGEDYFLVSADRPLKKGESPPHLKGEALRMIGQMPAKGLDWYELQYGAAAQAMLDRARQQGDMPALRSAASRYFHTAAGYEATLLLARRHLDRDHPLAAAMCYQRLIASPARARYEPALSISLAAALLRAGHHDDLAENALRDAKQHFSDAKIELGGQPIAWFAADDDPLAWLKTTLGPQQRRPNKTEGEWTVFGGNPSRNAASRGGAPLRSWRWKIPTSSSPVVAHRIEQLQRAYVDRRYIALPSFHPLAVGDTVLMRTASHLVAVDLKTGKRLWPKQPALEIATGSSAIGTSVFARPGTSQFMKNLDRRMWNDAIYGRLASDGKLLFAVRKLAPLSDQQSPRIGIDAAGRRIILPAGPRTYNQLDAFELATEGKLKWSVGGPPVVDRDAQGDRGEGSLAGAFFLGAPLPLKGRLYVLAEMSAKREIRLVVLAADTGRLLWSQQLAMAEWSVLRDPTRRAAGASPSYSNGLLICPTTAGAVVAVDLSTRRLKWGYRYPRNPRAQYTNVGRINALEQGSSDDDVGDGWADSSATLADGYVLVTPADNYTSRTRGGEIHCLNLIDGKRIWKRSRGKALYLACVTDGKVVLVGRDAVTALSIKDGTPHVDWPGGKKAKQADGQGTPKPLKAAAKLPAGALASGRGFLSNGHYYLPLTTGEIAKIDMSNGKITERIRLRDGFVPGNLVAYRDQIISQGAGSLAVFHQLDASNRWAEEQLKNDPNDALALLRRGRIRLEEGELDDAVADLRASRAAAPDDEEARQVLVEAMLAKLTRDFDQGAAPPAEFIKRLRRLVETPEERVALLRRLAVGLAKTGKRMEAFTKILQFIDVKGQGLGGQSAEETALEPVEPSLVVRRGRWIRAAIGQVRSEANASEREDMETAVSHRLLKTDTTATLQRFIEHFADFDAADPVRRALVDRLVGLTTMAQRERLLRRLERSADPAQRRAAVADMAALLVEARRPDEAAVYYARLDSDPELADVVCSDGKTGRELAAALAKDSPVRRYLGSSGDWPHGAVSHDANRMTGIRQPSLARSYRVKMRGPGGPFFTETTAHLDPNGRTLSARDAYGNERWRISLSAESIRSRYGSTITSLDSYCAARGHVLLFSSRNSIYAIDTLRASAESNTETNSSDGLPPAVLWRHERNEQIPGVAIGQGSFSGLTYRRPYYGSSRENRDVPALGPVTDAGVCFQRLRELVCVDPLTGQIQWVRRGFPKNCELFGDEELLFVVPPNGETAHVLRAADGHLLGERDVPPKREWVIALGRYLITRRIAGDGTLVIDAIDLWKEENRERWPRLNFVAGSQFTLVDRDALAVLQPDGHFFIHSLKDRRTLVDAHLKAEASAGEALQAIYVMPSRDRYLLFVDRRAPRVGRVLSVTPAPSGSDVNLKMLNARVYAFGRASGKSLWPAPARIDRYALRLHQPRELPVFVVARLVKFSGNAESELLCLDKRSGRLVYRSPPLTKPIANYTITGDPSQRAVSLIVHSGEKPTATRIVFSDEPTAPDPPYQGDQVDRYAESDDPFSDEPPDDDD